VLAEVLVDCGLEPLLDAVLVAEQGTRLEEDFLQSGGRRGTIFIREAPWINKQCR
jgi:hypothetical protein